ncbi:hypothetical protein BX600DRAFT_517477 [Xylariales sp. PMI_506]|nr:hypothetical protein BX600DRAFT_517477 [Xylariales sp. PMI_506]
MAPQKGGQASKQNQSAGGHGGDDANVKKLAGAPPANRPAVVPAIPLSYVQRQISAAKDKQQQQTQQQQQRARKQSNSTAPAPTTTTNATTLSPSAVGAASSLEAALAHPSSTNTAEAAVGRKRNKKAPGNEAVNGSGAAQKLPSLAPTASNGVFAGSAQGKKQAKHEGGRPGPRATGKVEEGAGLHTTPQLQHAGANGLSSNLNNLNLGENVSQAASSVQASAVPSVTGDAESAASSAAAENSEPGTSHAVAPATAPSAATTSRPSSATKLTRLPAEFTPSIYTRRQNHASDRRYESAPNSATFHGVNHMHRHNTNGVNVMFGGTVTPDSHTPSPAPPSGVSMHRPPAAAPNGLGADENHNFGHHMNGRHHPHHHIHTESNGTSLGAPVSHYREHVSGMDPYATVAAPVPLHAFPHNVGQFEPPTPHSFHGSHASGEFNGFDKPFPPNVHGYGDHPAHHGMPNGHSHMQPFLAPQQAFARRSALEEELWDSMYYFQSQFNMPDFADCVLELQYSDHESNPVKIHGHKLILARSPYLKEYIMGTMARDRAARSLVVHADDPYIRTDAWYFAVQRLYLHPLFTIPPMMSQGATSPAKNCEQLRFCLGYAAAGCLLKMNDVLLRGLQLAASLVDWSTVEEALGFSFDRAAQRYFIGDDGNDYLNIEFYYGPDVRILMRSITNFLISNFPPHFELDTSAIDPPKFARIPAVPVRVNSPSVDHSTPAIARGSSMRNASKTHRLPNIKFGDLPTALSEDDTSAKSYEPARCSPELSRILLNLPFDDVKYILATEVNGIPGWNNAQDRYRAIVGVVAEREARRLRAVEAVRAGTVPGSLEIQGRLAAPQRHLIVDRWDILNWQEEVIPSGGEGPPHFVRKWVPQFAAPDMEQPMYEPHPLESVV